DRHTTSVSPTHSSDTTSATHALPSFPTRRSSDLCKTGAIHLHRRRRHQHHPPHRIVRGQAQIGVIRGIGKLIGEAHAVVAGLKGVGDGVFAFAAVYGALHHRHA